MAASPARGAGRTLVFAHANGFPAGTYRQLFQAWRRAGWVVLAPERLGHDPAHPVESGWRRLRDELIGFVERHAGGSPVHLVGHSLGGYLALMTASRRPDLAAAVVLVDSPVLSGWRAHSVRVAKATGLIGRVSPGRVSRRRRDHWPTARDAMAHYASRHAFARWDPQVLQDYVTCGVEPDPARGGVQLAFRREVETRLYNTLPHDFGALLHRHPPRCPVAFLGGTQSVEVRQVGLAATRAVTRGRIEWIEGSHLFPMEQPLATAQAVLRLLDSPRSGMAPT
jgi:pimeloyl-ACP methyl ester carboxylesterase